MPVTRVFLKDGTVAVDKVLMAPSPSDGTRNYTFSAWEKMPQKFPWNHTTITHIAEKGEHYGSVTTRPLPPEIGKLPYGEERTAKVRAHYDALYEEAYRLIIEAFPEAGVSPSRRSMGSIDLYGVKV